MLEDYALAVDKYQVPHGWYTNDEEVVKSWQELKERIQLVLHVNPDREWVWRGQNDAGHGLTSSLYRAIKDATGRLPSELDMQEVERRMLEVAQSQFRLGAQNSVTFFAQLQHLGAPTRLIDVTRNAYVAAWFATQINSGQTDGRIFSFGFKPSTSLSNFDQELTSLGPPYWFANTMPAWGNGPKLLFPPVQTHPRVFAQNAGFIFDGLPTYKSGQASSYRKRNAEGKFTGYWKLAEIKQAVCIDVNFVSLLFKKARSDAAKTPTYTIRIPFKHKEEIRKQLALEMGITAAYLFPGIEGMAQEYGTKSGIQGLLEGNLNFI